LLLEPRPRLRSVVIDIPGDVRAQVLARPVRARDGASAGELELRHQPVEEIAGEANDGIVLLDRGALTAGPHLEELLEPLRERARLRLELCLAMCLVGISDEALHASGLELTQRGGE